MTPHDLARLTAEGVALWPAVLDALPRDEAGPSDGGDGEKRSSTKVEAPPSVNLDALDAVRTISREAAERVDEVRRLLGSGAWVLPRATGKTSLSNGLTAQSDPVLAWLRIVRVAHALLAERPDTAPLAEGIEVDLKRWVGQMRRVVGLDTPPTKLGKPCLHDGAPLLVAGKIGRIHPAVLARALSSRSLARMGTESVTWHNPETIYCPECRRRWVGVEEWRSLSLAIERSSASA